MATQTENAVINLVINGEQAKKTYKELATARREQLALVQRMSQTDPGYQQQLQRLREITVAERARRDELNRTSQAVQKQNSFFKDFFSSFSSTNAITGGVAMGTLVAGAVTKGVEAVVSLGKAVVDSYVKFEKFGTILTNALGDQSSARRSLNMLQDFAAKTPFQLEELTGSYVKLVNRGIIPTKEELTQMGDLAASQGKSFDQLTEAILDATTGEFERLKEFGIRASKNGDMVQLSFKGITQEVKNSEAAIQSAILKFGEMEGVKGGMEALSNTVGGQLSNMSDNWERLLTTLGSKTGGWLFSMTSSVNQFLDFLVTAVKSTEERIQEVADKSAGEALKRFQGKTAAEQTALYEGAKLEIEYYLKEIAVLEKKKQEIYKSRGDGSKAAAYQSQIDDYNLDLAKERAFIEAVDADRKQKAADDAKKKEQQRMENARKAKEDAEKWKKSLAGYENELAGIRSEYLQLSQAAQKGTVDELDAQLAVIDDKFNKVVAKLKKLANDPHVSKLVKSELLADIENIDKAGGLRDQTKANTTADFNKAYARDPQQDANQRSANLKRGEGLLNDVYAKGKSDMSTAEAADLAANDGESLEVREANRLAIQEMYAQKEFELEQQHLNDLKELYTIWGEDTAALDKQIADNAIKENQRASQKKLNDARQYQQAKSQIQQMELDTMQLGASTLTRILGENTMAYKAAFLLEQSVAAARVVINTEASIAAFAAANAGIPIVGLGLVASYTAMARFNQALSLAAIGAQTILGLKGKDKFSKGGIPDGPSHANGGLKLVGPYGQIFGEMEGGEPIISKQTYANNRSVVDALLNSGGQPLNYERVLGAVSATRQVAVSGGYAATTNGGAQAVDLSGLQQQMATQTAIFADMADKFKKFTEKPLNVDWNDRAYQEYRDRKQEIKDSATV